MERESDFSAGPTAGASANANVEQSEADQEWFWTERWQVMEDEVNEHVARGEIETFDDSASFLANLDELVE